jgi:hypothetical protein
MQLAQARVCKRDDLSVKDMMCAVAQIDTLYLNEVLNARVADILDAPEATRAPAHHGRGR